MSSSGKKRPWLVDLRFREAKGLTQMISSNGGLF